ncbi:MAG: hypothetical protein K9K32_00150 [Halanaerobiales bacterium]|nr:hypothetical protein [Halanaerobiales bacterium]
MPYESIYDCPVCSYKGIPHYEDCGYGYTTYGSVTTKHEQYMPVCPECKSDLNDEDKTGEKEFLDPS